MRISGKSILLEAVTINDCFWKQSLQNIQCVVTDVIEPVV